MDRENRKIRGIGKSANYGIFPPTHAAIDRLTNWWPQTRSRYGHSRKVLTRSPAIIYNLSMVRTIENLDKPAAIYCRTSTDEQKRNQTIQGQENFLVKYAEDRNWSIYKIYKDEGISGAYTVNRPAFRNLMADLEAGHFKIILVTEHSRITRSEDVQEQALIESLLQVYGAKIVSPGEGELDPSSFSGSLITTLKMRFAAHEKKQIAERVKRGRLEKLKQGIYCLNNTTYGHKKVVDHSKKPPGHKVIIDQKEARVLRHIYSLIVDKDYSLDQVVEDLNQAGVRTKKGALWRSPNLSRLLQQPSLTGKIYCNRFEFKQKPGQWKTSYDLIKERDKSEWITIDIPKIFDDEQFSLLRQKITEHRKYRKVNIKSGHYLLRGKLKCERCGAPLRPTSGGNSRKGNIVHYYVCSNRLISPKRLQPGQKRCKSPYVNADVLDQFVWDELFVKLIHRPEHQLKKWMGEEAKEEYQDHLKAKLTRINTDLSNLEIKLKNLIDICTDQEIDKKLFIELKKENDAHRAILEQDKANLAREIESVKLKKARNESLKENIKVLESARNIIGNTLVDPPSFSFKRQVIETFLPKGSYIEIVETGEVHYIETKLSKKAIKIQWDYILQGKLDFSAIIKLLQEEYRRPIHGVSHRGNQSGCL